MQRPVSVLSHAMMYGIIKTLVMRLREDSMIGLIARWTVPAEHRATVLDALARMTAEVEANEPGCLMYHSNISADDPNVIVLYERYVDEAAFDVHRTASYFEAIVLGEIVPLLAKREREFLTPVH